MNPPLKKSIGAAIFLGSLMSAHAALIDFGTSWPDYTGAGVGNYSSSPLNRVLAAENGLHSNESDIASFLTTVVSSTFGAADVTKFSVGDSVFGGAALAELGGSDGYFLVPTGWKYLVVQYDGPNGGSIVLDLGGNDAKVPFDSSNIWGTGDQHAVSHIAFASRVPGTTGDPVPDGGTTFLCLGISMLGLGGARRFLKQ